MNCFCKSVDGLGLFARVASGVRSFALLALCVASFLVMAGCTASTTAKTGSSPTPLISVTMIQSPPSSMIVGAPVQIAASVSQDVANAGVDWVAACSNAPQCGSFSPPHTASGGMTIFTAPLAVPAQKTVAVTALSSTDHSKAFATTVTIISTVTDVSLTRLPPDSAPAGATITVAATVTGDPSNEGVDWKAVCGVVNCTPVGWHSKSGEATNFVVPSALQIPDIVGSTVTITAYATADHGHSISASLTATDSISIALTQAPPTQILTNATATVVAVVSNDTTNAGVTWSVSCSGQPCGTISSHTASGAPATYTAGNTVPNPNDPAASHLVTITAISTAAGASISATASVTIVAPVSINISHRVPNDSIVQAQTAPLAATVINDGQTNDGVDWSVTCASPGACGAFSLTHTGSGTATIFTAPSAVPSGGTVTIIARSTADPTQSDTQAVHVTASLPPNQLLSGKFVLRLSGKNSTNGPYALGGILTGDGQGGIVDGALDVADASGNASASVAVIPATVNSTPANSSTYSIEADGRGQINLLLNTGALSSFGINGTGAMTLSIVFVDSHHALVNETDSFGSGTGTLDQQNINDLAAFTQGAWNSGMYSLILNGFDTSRSNAQYFVASAVNINLTASSYSYVTDQSDGGAITSIPFVAAASPNLGFTRNSRGEAIFASPHKLNLGLPTQFSLDLWLIDANHFVVTDWADSAFGSPPVIMTGYLTAQPSSPSVAGTYAFTNAGATTAGQSEAVGGIFICGSSGALDVVPLGGPVLSNQAVTAVCAAPVNGRSTITFSGSAGSGVSQFAAYPSLDQGLYVLELDGGTSGNSGPSGAGVAFHQNVPTPIAASLFNGNYASSFAANTTAGSETFTAQIVSDGASAVSGTANVNSSNGMTFTPSDNAILAGTFAASPNGRFPLTLAATPANGQPLLQIGTLNTICYIIDANSCALLGADLTAPGTGILLLQNPGI